MQEYDAKLLRRWLMEDDYQKLLALENPKLHRFVLDAIELCKPDEVLVFDDSPAGRAVTREEVVDVLEERRLTIDGHTVHFDGMQDQGRDREVTKYLVPKGETLSKALNQIEREEGLEEVRGLMKGCMRGRTMVIRFLSLGPTDSVFSIPCVECTDSWYVSHSLNLLYRPGYEQFKRIGDSPEFFATLHSAGKMDERMVSVESDKKRIYIDHTIDTVYSVNTQYAGNTVGLKKLALRLTIRKADREGWLCEHMFLAGVIYQVGMRNMRNYTLLAKLGKAGKPVLLKRGDSAMLDEWLAAAEYIVRNGNRNVILCERGIRTFETYTRNTLDLNAVVGAKIESCLPVMVDPSHGTGRVDMVAAMSKASIAAGADGLMLEAHVEPSKAWSDAAQTITPQQLKEIVDACNELRGP